MELSDTVSKDVANEVRKVILNSEGIRKFKDLKIRRVGAKTFIQAIVEVPEFMSHEEAHDLASRIEENIKSSLGQADVSIHTEPVQMEMSTEKLIEKLAMETEGVKGVHDVNIAYSGGNLYIVLHVYVNPRLSVRDADTIADKIEEQIEGTIRKIGNVTVHLEPDSTEELKGPTVNKDEIINVIHEITRSDKLAPRIKRVVTYVADKKRYINIDCYFSNQVSVEEAHKIASEIEEKVKKHFVETIVTVHTESE
jgi:divalent metal cation (Fe/Co/Zn/Cd) transporter